MLATAGAAASMKDGAGGIDPQTATDLANERLVMDTLAAEFPSHGLIGEEAAAAAGRVPDVEARPTWIVDPIDGTQNFCHALPISCVSIGLCVGGLPSLGVVYDPYRDELFVGIASEAAYLNGQRLCAAAAPSLEKALVITDVGYERSEVGARRLGACFEALLQKNVFGLRIVGSTVVALSWLAAGRCSAVYMGVAKKDSPKAWDWAAAWAIGAAAGVTFLRLDAPATPFSLSSPSVCAAGSTELAEELRRELRAVLATVP